MKVELITTGEEVLSGQITDTNASWLSDLLGRNGLAIHRRTTVGDRLEDLVSCFRERARAADIIIVNGGLGPTSDDLSAQAAALALDEPLVEFGSWVEVLKTRYGKLGRVLSDSNRKQALLPRSATIIDNPVGTACGFSIDLHGAMLLFTPGVPHELKRMIRNEILPLLTKKFQSGGAALLQRLHCFGMPEAHLNDLLRPIPLPAGVSLGFRAHLPVIEIKIMGRDTPAGRIRRDMDAVAEAVRAVLGAVIVFEGDSSLEAEVQAIMIQKGYNLALAESCTGGLLSGRLVDVAGSSAYLQGAYVTYSNHAKSEMVGVLPKLIAQHGAVSSQVARAMAEGAKKRIETSHGLAITGVAGPGGGTPQKPVGTVAFALATPAGVYSQMVAMPDLGRRNIRLISAVLALDMLRRHLLGLEVLGSFEFIKTLECQTA